MKTGIGTVCPDCEGDHAAFCQCIADAFTNALGQSETHGHQSLIQVCSPDQSQIFFVNALYDCENSLWVYTKAQGGETVLPGADFVPCSNNRVIVPEIEAGALITVQNPGDGSKLFVNAILDENTGTWTYSNAENGNPVVPMVDFIPCQEEECTLFNSVGTISSWADIKP